MSFMSTDDWSVCSPASFTIKQDIEGKCCREESPPVACFHPQRASNVKNVSMLVVQGSKPYGYVSDMIWRVVDK